MSRLVKPHGGGELKPLLLEGEALAAEKTRAQNLKQVRMTSRETGDLIIEPKELRVTVAGAPAKLRLKEFQLLVALASREGQLCTRQMLAEEVWGYDFLPSSRTIDVHIRRVRQAIEEPSAYTYIQTVHGMGYRFQPVLKDGTEAAQA